MFTEKTALSFFELNYEKKKIKFPKCSLIFKKYSSSFSWKSDSKNNSSFNNAFLHEIFEDDFIMYSNKQHDVSI